MRIMALKIKRIYETAADDDGFRVLVDRLWPRGLSKERAIRSTHRYLERQAIH